MAGAVLSVTVTIDDEEYTDLTAAVAGEDKSAEVELVDDYGLQSDGTGIIGDKLTVTYGADFGTPQNISWYKNGKVVATNSVGDIVNNGLTRTIEADEWGTGTYKVTITNTDGDMATTNEIVITDKEEAAEIIDFDIEDDYTDGTDITYNAQDGTAVATVTLSKNYAGRIEIYKKSDTKYTARVDRITTTIEGPTRTAAVATADTTGGAVNDGASELCSTPATNYQVLNALNHGAGYGYINDDGSVTYKFQVNGGALTRGTEYVVVFDQTSISTDTPGTGKANVYEEAVAVPYVQVPAKIAVTKVSAGNAPEVTFYGEDGSALEWLGTATTTNANFDTLGECGIASAEVYSAKIKTNDTSKGTALGAATTNPIEHGVWTSGQVAPDPIDAYWFAQVKTTAGVYGSGQVTLLSEPAPAAQDSASDMDLIENKDTATTATVSFSNLRSNGTVYIVRGYWDLATNGALNQGANPATYDNRNIAVTDHATTVEDIFAGFNRDDSTTYVATANVTAGTEKVDIANAISKVTANSVAGATTTNGDILEDLTIGAAGTDASAVASGKHFNNNYIAVFIPDDEVNYGMIYTNGALGAPATSSTNSTVGTTAAAKSPLQITQEVKTYTLAGKFDANAANANGFTSAEVTYNNDGTRTGTAADVTDATANIVTLKDQFGEVMHTSEPNTQPGTAAVPVADWTLTTRGDSNTTGVTNIHIQIGWNAAAGVTAANNAAGDATTLYYNTITVSLGAAQTGTETSTWTGSTGLGQTITAKVNADGTIALSFS